MTVQQQLQKDGFAIVNNLYTPEEVHAIIQQIENADTGKANFRKSADLFAIRQFLKEVPQVLQTTESSCLPVGRRLWAMRIYRGS